MTATATIAALRAPRKCVDEALRKITIAENRIGIVDVWECSPRRFEDNNCHADEIVDQLFLPDALLCVARSRSRFETCRREKLRGRLHNMQFIVPSPMTAAFGTTLADGKSSAHTLDNTGPRRFVVTEFDHGTIDEQAALISHLAERAPLTLVVHSGNKSLHAWFYCLGQPENRVHGFLNHAVSLGADPATWGRSQFVRLPDGRRRNGQRQTTYYLNPATVKQ